MDKMRDFLNSWPGRIAMALCLLPLAFFGFERAFVGRSNPNAVATIDKTDIDQQTFQDALNARRQQLVEEGIDANAIDDDVLAKVVLDEVINRALLELQTKALGMGLSDAMIIRILKQDPTFLDENGKYSDKLFKQFLLRGGMTKEMLFDRVRTQNSIYQFSNSIIGTAIYPMSSAIRLANLQSESRPVWLYRYNAKDFVNKVSVSDAEIADYYAKHKNNIKSDAMVDLSFIELNPKEISVGEPSPSELEAAFAKYKEENGVGDNRELSQILLTGADAQKRANEIKARLDKGESFEALAKQYSNDDSGKQGGAIGQFKPSVFGESAQAVQKALSGLAEGQISQPVQTTFGYHIFKVTKIATQATVMTDAVKTELIVRLKQQKQEAAFAEKVAKINEAIVDGLGLNDIAAQEGLKVNSIKDYTKVNNKSVLAQPTVLKAVFDEATLQEQAALPGINIGNHVLWVQPSNYRPEAVLNQAQANAKIKALLAEQKAVKLAFATANQMATTIKSLDDMKKSGLSFVSLGMINRSNAVLTPKEITSLFMKPAPKDGVAAWALEDTHGASILIGGEISQMKPSGEEEAKYRQIAAVARDNLGADSLADYLQYLRSAKKTKVNEGNIAH